MAGSDLFLGVVAIRLAVALLVTLVVRELPTRLRDPPDDASPVTFHLAADARQLVGSAAEPTNDMALRDMLTHD